VRSSPERRRLRFSFQINNVKDPEPKLPEPPRSGTTRLAPDVGGGGYLSNLEFRVKPFFNKTVRTNPPNPPESKPSKPKQPSTEDHQSSQARIYKKLSKDLRVTSEALANPQPLLPGERLLVKPNPRVNLEFCRTSADHRD
jgi:hypothetical protein